MALLVNLMHSENLIYLQYIYRKETVFFRKICQSIIHVFLGVSLYLGLFLYLSTRSLKHHLIFIWHDEVLIVKNTWVSFLRVFLFWKSLVLGSSTDSLRRCNSIYLHVIVIRRNSIIIIKQNHLPTEKAPNNSTGRAG